MRLRSIRRLLRRFAQIDAGRRGLVVEAVACLILARLTLALLPFPRVVGRLGNFVPPDDARALRDETAPTPEQVQFAQQIGWAVTRAGRHVPFKAVCLPQALVARAMLRRRGVASVMHFGAARNGQSLLDTHAWLDAAGVEVTGYPVHEKFSEIGCLVC